LLKQLNLIIDYGHNNTLLIIGLGANKKLNLKCRDQVTLTFGLLYLVHL
jgi:hypothetical protein